jgi:hypothetical protein
MAPNSGREGGSSGDASFPCGGRQPEVRGGGDSCRRGIEWRRRLLRLEVGEGVVGCGWAKGPLVCWASVGGKGEEKVSSANTENGLLVGSGLNFLLS